MTVEYKPCPRCGYQTESYKNPLPTVDVIIEMADDIILIERKNKPHGWALPGGFVDYGETLEQAAIREVKEETGLDIKKIRLFGCYSDPTRDPRYHTITTVYVAEGSGVPRASDDALSVALFNLKNLPITLCFDHGKILSDYTGNRH